MIVQKGKRFGFSLGEIERLLSGSDVKCPEENSRSVTPVDLTHMLTAEQITKQIALLEEERAETIGALEELRRAQSGD